MESAVAAATLHSVLLCHAGHLVRCMRHIQADADWQSLVMAKFCGEEWRQWQVRLHTVFEVLKDPQHRVLTSAEVCKLSVWLEPLLVSFILSCLSVHLFMYVYLVLSVCASASRHTCLSVYVHHLCPSVICLSCLNVCPSVKPAVCHVSVIHILPFVCLFVQLCMSVYLPMCLSTSCRVSCCRLQKWACTA